MSFSDESMCNGQQIVDAMIEASRDVLELTDEEYQQLIQYPYEVGTTIFRIIEGLMEAVCALLAVPPVRIKRTGEKSFWKPGMQLLSSPREFGVRVRALERSTIPHGVLRHVQPLVQMLAIVPFGFDVPRCGLILREWVISMADYHNAKGRGREESAALERLFAAKAPISNSVRRQSVSPRSRKSPSQHNKRNHHENRSLSPIASLTSPSMSPRSPVMSSPRSRNHSAPRSPRSPRVGIVGALNMNGLIGSGGGPRSPRSRSPRSPRSPVAGASTRGRSPERHDSRVETSPTGTNKSGGVLHVGGTWARSPTGRSPKGTPRRSISRGRSRSAGPNNSLLMSPTLGLPPLPPPSPRMNQIEPSMRDMTPLERETAERVSSGSIIYQQPTVGNRIQQHHQLPPGQQHYGGGLQPSELDYAMSERAVSSVVVGGSPSSPPRARTGTVPSPSPHSGSNLNSWLAARGLGKFTQILQQQGIYQVQDILNVSEDTLSVLPIGPKRKLLAYASGRLRPP